MDVRMPELFGSHHEHGPEHRWHERRELNAMDPWLSSIVTVLLIGGAAFTLWVGIYYLVGEISKLLS